MADRRSLGMLGFLLCGVTTLVMLTAAMVTKNHLDGRLTLESRQPLIAATAQTAVR
jgi:hypothetical protein